MRSNISDLAERQSRRFVHLVSARPWLCGATALALATAALFAWFLTQRLDDVDVSISSGGTRSQLQRESLRGLSAPGPLVDAAAAQPLAAESNTTRVAAHRPASPPFYAFEDGSFSPEPAVRRVAAEAAVPSAWRGAWLTGTIEEMTDEPARHAARTVWPGLADYPVGR